MWLLVFKLDLKLMLLETRGFARLVAAVTFVASMLSCSLWFHLVQCLSCGT